MNMEAGATTEISPDLQSKKVIAVIGLGYVGLPVAIEFGKKYKVIGFDINKTRISQLQQGVDVTNEVNNEDFIESRNLEFTNNYQDLNQADIFIITVPTPVDSANRPDLKPLSDASHLVGAVLRTGGIVIYESTVYPGCTEEFCAPILEKASGLRFNRDFFCGYSPERINPADKVNTLTKIKKVTSGSTTQVADEIDNLYKTIITAGTHKAASIKVAEAAKVIENCQRDLNIAFINELSIIFERMKIDTMEVLEAAQSKWNFLPFRPGMVGGHCIGVDPYYLTHKAEELGYHPQVILAGRRINDNMARYASRVIVRKMLQNGHDVARSKIGILGVTFKENCPDVRNSKVLDMVRELRSWGLDVIVHDPVANKSEIPFEFQEYLAAENELKNLSSLIIAVGHDGFRAFTLEKVVSMCNSSPRPIIADLKAIYDSRALQKSGVDVFRL